MRADWADNRDPLRFGAWTALSVLGRGGCGVVYEAVSTTGQLGAVKVLHPELSVQLEWRGRFEREARLMRDLAGRGHPRLLDTGMTDAGSPFVVLERLRGCTLAELLAKQGRLDAARALPIIDQLLRTLSVLHASGVVHRDIKPSNLFLTTHDELKVLDLGIASQPPTERGAHATRGLLGTPAFMSPEQARGRWDLVDARSDLWSVGAVLFTLLTAEHVHHAVTENEQLAIAVACPARSILQLAPGLDRPLARVIDRALAYDPAHRFASAEELRAALRSPFRADFLGVGGLRTLREATSAGPPRRARSATAWLALVAAAALATPSSGVPTRNQVCLSALLEPDAAAPSHLPSPGPPDSAPIVAVPTPTIRAQGKTKHARTLRKSSLPMVDAPSPAAPTAAPSAVPPPAEASPLDARAYADTSPELAPNPLDQRM